MKGKFKLTGLSKPNSATLQMPNGDIFNAPTELPQDRFSALFDLFKKGEWRGDEIGVLEYDKVSDEGQPIDPKLVEVVL